MIEADNRAPRSLDPTPFAVISGIKAAGLVAEPEAAGSAVRGVFSTVLVTMMLTAGNRYI